MLKLDGVEWLLIICDLWWATNAAFVPGAWGKLPKTVVSTADLHPDVRNRIQSRNVGMLWMDSDGWGRGPEDWAVLYVDHNMALVCR